MSDSDLLCEADFTAARKMIAEVDDLDDVQFAQLTRLNREEFEAWAYRFAEAAGHATADFHANIMAAVMFGVFCERARRARIAEVSHDDPA